jgi:hypothetical protein
MQELIAKDIDAADLDFSRYGDTFFEVIFSSNAHIYHLLIYIACRVDSP